ncbi:N-acetylmuramoyl-L-alanine amidase family protein [Halobacteroides halobius]|nr:N-acetylmuramoyl-L-alanine amidase family protein [Halobacteroides halobius]
MPKRLLMGILVLVLICSFSNSLYAADDIKLLVNNKKITNSLDYQIVDQNILIPLRTLSNALSIKLKWFNLIKTLRLETEDKVIKFRLGDRNLQVNNKLIKMPVAPKEKDGRLMVPLKSLGEVLGLVIESNPQQRIVNIFEVQGRLKEIKYQKTNNYKAIAINISQKVGHKVSVLKDPRRIVLDLKTTRLIKKINNIKVDNKLIKQVRVAQFNGNTVRVVVDLASKVDYKLVSKKLNQSYQYLIKLSPLITDIKYEATGLKINATADIRMKEPVYLSNPRRIVVDLKNAVFTQSKKKLKINNPLFKEIRVSQYQTNPNNIVRVVFEAKKNLELRGIQKQSSLVISPIVAKLEKVVYNSDKSNQVLFELSTQVKPDIVPLKKGDRLVFDFFNTTNEFQKEDLKIDSRLIKEIRISQFNQYITRAVIDLSELVSYQIDWEGNQLQLNLMNKLQEIKVNDMKARTKVDISLLTPGEYDIYQLPNPKRLVIDIPNAIVDKKKLKLINNSDIVSDIRFSQYSVTPYSVRVVLDLKDDINLQVKSPDRTKHIVINTMTNNLAGKIIVVDPGHGGYDPGALGSFLREKNITLDIGLKLEDILEAAGAKVVMTRKTDQFISLEERAKLANKLNADIFVSIHINSHYTKDAFGTEIFIREDYSDNSLVLAHFIQDELVNEINTFNRGRKEGNLYVLEHTKMPAVLSEIAFISNPEEEELLSRNQFRSNVAVGLYKGISKYFRFLEEES